MYGVDPNEPYPWSPNIFTGLESPHTSRHSTISCASPHTSRHSTISCVSPHTSRHSTMSCASPHTSRHSTMSCASTPNLCHRQCQIHQLNLQLHQQQLQDEQTQKKSKELYESLSSEQDQNQIQHKSRQKISTPVNYSPRVSIEDVVVELTHEKSDSHTNQTKTNGLMSHDSEGDTCFSPEYHSCLHGHCSPDTDQSLQVHHSLKHKHLNPHILCSDHGVTKKKQRSRLLTFLSKMRTIPLYLNPFEIRPSNESSVKRHSCITKEASSVSSTTKVVITISSDSGDNQSLLGSDSEDVAQENLHQKQCTRRNRKSLQRHQRHQPQSQQHQLQQSKQQQPELQQLELEQPQLQQPQLQQHQSQQLELQRPVQQQNQLQQHQLQQHQPQKHKLQQPKLQQPELQQPQLRHLHQSLPAPAQEAPVRTQTTQASRMSNAKLSPLCRRRSNQQVCNTSVFYSSQKKVIKNLCL